MHLSALSSLNLDGLIGGLVALQLVGPRRLVAYKTLVTFEHQDGSVDQVEVVLGLVLNGVTVCI